MDSLTQSAIQTAEDMQRQLIAKASEDETFRAQLLADPKGTIKNEFGVEVPEFVNLQVHQNDPNAFHIVLPPSGNFELDERTLEAVAAGLCCCG